MPLKGDFSILPAMKLRIGRREVNISNPDKVFFPKRRLKKIDLVNYYLDVAPHVLNHVAAPPDADEALPGRGGGVVLLPEAGAGESPAVARDRAHQVPGGRTADFAVCDERRGARLDRQPRLHRAAHVASRVDDVERPDYLLIDLDPSEGNPWRHVRKIALVVKEVMDELGLASFPKTSGATGLHILAPIKPELGFPEVRRFAKAMAQEVERRIGDQEVATTTWKVADRRGVFVDFGQNSRDRTIASAYSIRPTPDARASAPLDWDEVPTVKPERFTLTTMRKRIDEVGDLTSGHVAPQAEPATALREARPRAGRPEQARQRPPAGGAQRWESDQRVGWRQRSPAQPSRAGSYSRGQEVTRRSGRLGGAAGGPRATCTAPGPCRGGSGGTACRGGSGCCSSLS